MAHTAINIVLLPPKELHDAVLAFNNSLIPEEGFLHFESQMAIPHISVAMAVVHDAPLLNLIAEIISTGAAFPPLTANLAAHTVFSDDRAMPLHWLEFQPNKLLFKLHTKMMEVIEGSAFHHFGNEAFALNSDESISKSDKDYVSHYIESHQQDSLYRPHITLGFGTGDVALLPKLETTYSFHKMGLFQMGAHGSCREEIAIFDLEG
jgi:hypothetical protein